MDPSAIGKGDGKVENTGGHRKVGGDVGAPGGARSAASTADTVELTSSAKLLERLEKTLSSLPAVDGARVAEIRDAIENGDYEINADAIAEAMIRFDRSFGE